MMLHLAAIYLINLLSCFVCSPLMADVHLPYASRQVVQALVEPLTAAEAALRANKVRSGKDKIRRQ